MQDEVTSATPGEGAWTIRENSNAPGTFYVVDDTGWRVAFCQTRGDAERILSRRAAPAATGIGEAAAAVMRHDFVAVDRLNECVSVLRPHWPAATGWTTERRFFVVDWNSANPTRHLRGPFHHEETAGAVRREMEQHFPEKEWNLAVVYEDVDAPSPAPRAEAKEAEPQHREGCAMLEGTHEACCDCQPSPDALRAAAEDVARVLLAHADVAEPATLAYVETAALRNLSERLTAILRAHGGQGGGA